LKVSGNYPSWPDYPLIENEHLVDDARLYANRKSLVASLPIPDHAKIAEIGVWQGAFSTFLMEEFQPRQFFAFDVFNGHTLKNWNGYTGAQIFDGLTHRQYYERGMAPHRGTITVVEGPSAVTLRDYTDRSFDLVYVDADHEYASVRDDTAQAVEMVTADGFLVFNDYTLLDPGNVLAYGVVPVVNDLVVNRGWRIVGYALQEHLFCDIALRRA
jgi:hypothetical protein